MNVIRFSEFGETDQMKLLKIFSRIDFQQMSKSSSICSLFSVTFCLATIAFLSSCEELLEPVIIPTPTPVPIQKPEPNKELEDIGPPRPPAEDELASQTDNYIHPAALEIKKLWQATRSKLEQDIEGYPQTFGHEARFEKAAQIRKQWWDLNKKLVSDRNVDFSVLRVYSPFIDSVIQMIDSFYSVEMNQYGDREFALAKTEVRLMNERIEKLK